MTLKEGTIIGKYEILKKLSVDSFSVVYEAKEKGTNTFYELKAFPKKGMEEQYKDLFLSSKVILEKLTKLNHRNISKYYGSEEDENNYYLIMEHCNGGPLDEIFHSTLKSTGKGFSEEAVQYFMTQILDALNFIHSNKIIHRDIKMRNISLNFISEDDKKNSNLMKADIKICGFDVAFDMAEKEPKIRVGTTPYMAPEVYKLDEHPNESYNEKVDIWSLGITCYEMLVGRVPFFEVIRDFEKRIELLKEAKFDDVSKEAAEFLKCMIEIDSAKRKSASELLQHSFLSKFTTQK